jgi:hypothetical protein
VTSAVVSWTVTESWAANGSYAAIASAVMASQRLARLGIEEHALFRIQLNAR